MMKASTWNRKKSNKITLKLAISVLSLLMSPTIANAGPLSCAVSAVSCANALKKSAPGLAGKIEACKALRTCKKKCVEVKKSCKSDGRSNKKACISDCNSTFKKGPERRNCKKACRAEKQTTSRECRQEKRKCKSDCRGNFKTPECKSARRAATQAAAGGISACATVASCILPAP